MKADMGKTEQLQRVKESGIVAVIRARSSELLVDVAEALLAGGVTVMEVTFTVPGALRALERVADRVGDRVLLGAGTVLDTETGRAAMLAGAEFIVSPSTNVDLIRLCRRYDKAVMPGALTPTEVVTAWEAGADIVKIFPADALGGAPYLKALRGPLPQVNLMPTGGVDLKTAAGFLRAGAFCAGHRRIARRSGDLEAGDMARIESLARQYVDIVRATRENGG